MDPNVHNIILVGFMGTGKTSVSRMLASRLGWNCVDTDAEIERRESRSIPEIFMQEGECRFRSIETAVLRDVLGGTQQVVATGGGAVLAEENRILMRERGFVAALTAKAETIIERVRQDPERPLLKGNLEERVARLLEDRKHAYDFAHMRVDTSHLDIGSIAQRIMDQAGSL